MHCQLCPETMPATKAMDHLRVMHPDAYGDGPVTWPDGQPVIIDMTLEPHEFGEERR